MKTIIEIAVKIFSIIVFLFSVLSLAIYLFIINKTEKRLR